MGECNEYFNNFEKIEILILFIEYYFPAEKRHKNILEVRQKFSGFHFPDMLLFTNIKSKYYPLLGKKYKFLMIFLHFN